MHLIFRTWSRILFSDHLDFSAEWKAHQPKRKQCRVTALLKAQSPSVPDERDCSN